MSNLIKATGSVRLPFLSLTVVCLLLGVSSVIFNGTQLDPALLILVALGGLSAHASVNLLNEYIDYKSGLDLKTIKTPFSGGSGTLPKYPEAAATVLLLGITTLLITVSIGLYLTWLQGLPLFILGLCGVIIILVYTHWINRWPLICLIAPGVAFGPIMVTGTELALSNQVTPLALVISLVPFFVVNNLLLLNQIPDIEADRSVGRNHFPIRYGAESAFNVFRQFNLLAAIVIISGYLTGLFPALVLIALLPLIVNSGKVSIDNLENKMKTNALAANATPALSSLALLIAPVI